MDVRPRPNLLWRLFVVIGLGTLVLLSVSDDAWDRFRGAVGEVIPRSAIRQLVVGTLGVHALEAIVVFARARRAGLEHPGRWAISTFLWGFPVMSRLGRAKRAIVDGEPSVEVDVVAAAA
ncbi:MAG: TMEM254 family protein [Microthrixaceae bacterium]|jgi:hypothetical protein